MSRKDNSGYYIAVLIGVTWMTAGLISAKILGLNTAEILGLNTAESKMYSQFNQCMVAIIESKQVTPETIAECKTLLPKE